MGVIYLVELDKIDELHTPDRSHNEDGAGQGWSVAVFLRDLAE